jgi:hypothetical protein
MSWREDEGDFIGGWAHVPYIPSVPDTSLLLNSSFVVKYIPVLSLQYLFSPIPPCSEVDVLIDSELRCQLLGSLISRSFCSLCWKRSLSVASSTSCPLPSYPLFFFPILIRVEV